MKQLRLSIRLEPTRADVREEEPPAQGELFT